MAKQTTGRERSEARRLIVVTDPSVCYYCKSTGLTEADNFCPNCAFPQKGSQSSMKNFIWNINNKHSLLADQKKAVNKARNLLFGLAILFALFSIILGIFLERNLETLITNMIVCVIYLALGVWSRKHPFPAILTGFFLYITLIVINGVIDPSGILKGLIWKAFIIAGFFYGYKGVKDSALLEEELESIKKAKDLSATNEVRKMPD